MATAASELEEQSMLSIVLPSENVGAHFAPQSVIDGRHSFPFEQRVPNEPERNTVDALHPVVSMSEVAI